MRSSRVFRRVSILLSLQVCFFGVCAQQPQRYLTLSKVNKPRKQIIFYEGESMRFRLKGERFFNSGWIQGFGEDEIRFHYYRIKLDEIAEIDVDNKNFTIFNVKSWSNVLLVSGPLFLAIDQFNQGVIRDEPAGINSETVVVSGTMVASGLMLRWLRKRRWKCDRRKHRMKIIDFTGS